MKIFLFVVVFCFLLLGFIGQALASPAKPITQMRQASAPRLRVIAARRKKPAYKFTKTDSLALMNVVVSQRMDDASFELSTN